MSQPPNEAQYGQTAAALGFVSDAQVRECLQIQVKMREMGIDDPLGEILVKKRYLTPQQHQAVLKKLGVHSNPIPGYTLHGKIGQGGMGAVYKATQASVNRLVAIKVLSPQFGKDATFVARFFQEARAAGKLSHKNLIAAIDVGEASGLFYFVMEYVIGRSCRDLLNTEGPFSEKKAVDVAHQMAEALEYIHSHGLVHRDIKPENILLTTEGGVKLCDLGLAKSTSATEQSLTQPGLAVGTPYFMSPEQCRSEKDIDIRADLYSLGATLYFLVAGRHPYEGQSALDTMNLHLSAAVPDPRKAVPALGEDFAHVVQKLMAKDRDDRYPTPKELLEDLRHIQSGSAPIHARTPVSRAAALHKPLTGRLSASAPPRRTSRAKPRWPFVAAISAAAVMAAAFLALNRGGRDASRPDPPPYRPPERQADLPAPPNPAPAALARARESSAKDPNDLPTLIPLYEKATEASRGTPFFDEARRVLEGLYRRELETLDAQIRESALREEFAPALAVLLTARSRHEGTDWTPAIASRIDDFRAKVARLYASLKQGAVEARQRGAENDVVAARSRVQRWGLSEYREDFDQNLPPSKPAPRPVAAAADPYTKLWESAARRGLGRDYAAAAALIEGAPHADAAADLELFRGAGAVLAEALQALSRIPRGQKLSLSYSDETGALRRIEDTVYRADALRVEFRREDGPVIVDAGEIAADTLVEIWRTRSPRRASKDGRAAALLCLLEGDPAAARRHSSDLPAKYWELGGRLEEERSRPDPAARKKEEEARRSYHAAERDFLDPAETADAIRRFRSMLKDLADTAFIRRNRAAIVSRLEGGREFFFVAEDLRGGGTFRISTLPKGPPCWTSEADSDASRRAENSVEITFSVLPDTEYRAWAYVGGCCMETLGFQVQAADGPDAAAGSPQAVKHSVSITKTHTSHGGAKQPSRWGWVALPLPKYSSPGTRRVRLLTDQKGFSVAYAFASALKNSPPKDAELKDLEKARAEAAATSRAATDPGLVGWWKLDERGGPSAADATRNRNAGTLRNGAVWAPGKIGGALAVNGTDGHARIPDSPSINTIGAQVSAAAWVLRQADQEGYRLVLSRQLGTDDENQFWLGFRDNQFGFSVTTGKGTRNVLGRTAPNGEWLHLAATYDGTTLRLYVNGVEASSETHGGALSPSARPLMIGADEFDDMGSVQEVPKASLDEVRLYNRALTPTEVAALASGRR